MLTRFIDRWFPRKYRVVSGATGPGVGYPYRFLYHAAFDAVKFEYTEFRAGLPHQGWHVQSKKGQGHG